MGGRGRAAEPAFETVMKIPLTPQRPLERTLGACCAVLLAGLAGLTVVDVIGRYWFNAPVAGAFELTQLMLGALVFAALPLATFAGEHVEVDMAYGAAPRPLKAAMRTLGALLSAAALWVIAWRLALHGARLAEDGGVTDALSVPLAPLGWFAAAMTLLSGGLALARLARPVRRGEVRR